MMSDSRNVEKLRSVEKYTTGNSETSIENDKGNVNHIHVEQINKKIINLYIYLPLSKSRRFLGKAGSRTIIGCGVLLTIVIMFILSCITPL